MKLLLMIALLCINNFGVPAKGIKSSCATKAVNTNTSFQLAPSVLIVTY